MGGSRVLSSNDQSINSKLLTPVVALDIVSTNTLDLILKEGRHGAGQLHGVLLRVAEACDGSALQERFSVDGDVDKDDGAVADSRNRLAGLVELLNELDGSLILDEVKHGAVTTRVEDGVELGSLAEELAQRSGVLPDGLLLVQELDRLGVALKHLDGNLIKRRLSASGGSDDNLNLGVGLVLANEVIVGMGKLGLTRCELFVV